MCEFKGKKIFIIGGASGIGLATAKMFLSIGSKVSILDKNTESLKGNKKLLEFGENFIVKTGDVRIKEDIERALVETINSFGGIDILIYSAGIFPNKLIVDMSEKDWDKVNDINSKGAFLACRAIAKYFITNEIHGHIITITSGSHSIGRVGSAHYCASKASLAMLTKVLAMELAPFNIKVNSIAPGLVENPIINESYLKEYINRVPYGRIAKPSDIANAIRMIVSPANKFITGQIINVDGGMSAGLYGLPLSNKN